MRVEILIERVSVSGVRVASRQQLTAALEHELVRLLSRPGVPELLARDLHLRRVATAPLPLPAAPGADASLGRGLARRVVQSLYGAQRGGAPPPAKSA